MVRVVVGTNKPGNNSKEDREKSFTSALSTFKRKVNRDGILQECRKREYYVKPGVKRRLKHEAAMKEKRIALKKSKKKDY